MSDFDIKFVKCHHEAIIPSNNGGISDLFAVDYCEIIPLARKVIKTGIIISIPYPYCARIFGDRDLAVKYGVFVQESLILGENQEIELLLFNSNFYLENLNIKRDVYSQIFGQRGRYCIHPKEKIAQLVFEKMYVPDSISN